MHKFLWRLDGKKKSFISLCHADSSLLDSANCDTADLADNVCLSSGPYANPFASFCGGTDRRSDTSTSIANVLASFCVNPATTFDNRCMDGVHGDAEAINTARKSLANTCVTPGGTGCGQEVAAGLTVADCSANPYRTGCDEVVFADVLITRNGICSGTGTNPFSALCASNPALKTDQDNACLTKGADAAFVGNDCESRDVVRDKCDLNPYETASLDATVPLCTGENDAGVRYGVAQAKCEDKTTTFSETYCNPNDKNEIGGNPTAVKMARNTACAERGTTADGRCATRQNIIDTCKIADPFANKGCDTATHVMTEQLRETYCTSGDRTIFDTECNGNTYGDTDKARAVSCLRGDPIDPATTARPANCGTAELESTAGNFIYTYCQAQGSGDPDNCPLTFADTRNDACQNTDPWGSDCNAIVYNDERKALCATGGIIPASALSDTDRATLCDAVAVITCDMGGTASGATVVPNPFDDICSGRTVDYTSKRLARCEMSTATQITNLGGNCSGAGLSDVICGADASKSGTNPFAPICQVAAQNANHGNLASSKGHFCGNTRLNDGTQKDNDCDVFLDTLCSAENSVKTMQGTGLYSCLGDNTPTVMAARRVLCEAPTTTYNTGCTTDHGGEVLATRKTLATSCVEGGTNFSKGGTANAVCNQRVNGAITVADCSANPYRTECTGGTLTAEFTNVTTARNNLCISSTSEPTSNPFDGLCDVFTGGGRDIKEQRTTHCSTSEINPWDAKCEGALVTAGDAGIANARANVCINNQAIVTTAGSGDTVAAGMSLFNSRCTGLSVSGGATVTATRFPYCNGALDGLTGAGGSPALCKDDDLSGAICGTGSTGASVAGSNPFAPICTESSGAALLDNFDANGARTALAEACRVTNNVPTNCSAKITGTSSGKSVADCTKNPYNTENAVSCFMNAAFDAERTDRVSRCGEETTAFDTLCDFVDLTDNVDTTTFGAIRIARGTACATDAIDTTSENCGDEGTQDSYLAAYCSSDHSGIATNVRDCPTAYAAANATAVANVSVPAVGTGENQLLNSDGSAGLDVIAVGAANDTSDADTNFIELAADGTLLTTGTNRTGLTLTDTNDGFAFADNNNKLYVGLLATTNLGAPLPSDTPASVTWNAKLSVLFGATPAVVEADSIFTLLINYGTANTANTLAVMGDGPTIGSLGVFSIVDGKFTNNGVIYGKVAFDSASAGTLTGLIGTNGAVGIFASNSGTAYVGGFIASETTAEAADCSADGTPFNLTDCPDAGDVRLAACGGTIDALNAVSGGSLVACNTAELSGVICASSGTYANPFAPICSEPTATAHNTEFDQVAVQVAFCTTKSGNSECELPAWKLHARNTNDTGRLDVLAADGVNHESNPITNYIVGTADGLELGFDQVAATSAGGTLGDISGFVIGDLKLSDLDSVDAPAGDKDGVSFATFTNSATSSVSGSNDRRYYVGLWNGTDLGAPLNSTEQGGTWKGKIALVTSSALYSTVGFDLVVEFGGTNGNTLIAENIPLTGDGNFTINGKFTSAGVIYGTTTFTIANQASNGSLTGLIGAKGAVGAFVSTSEIVNDAGEYAGGFVAHTNVDCSATGTPFDIVCADGNPGKLPLCGGPIADLLAAGQSLADCKHAALSGAICGIGASDLGSNHFAPICYEEDALHVTTLMEAKQKRNITLTCSALTSSDSCRLSLTGKSGGTTVFACYNNPFLSATECLTNSAFDEARTTRRNLCTTEGGTFNPFDTKCDAATATDATYLSNVETARDTFCNSNKATSGHAECGTTGRTATICGAGNGTNVFATLCTNDNRMTFCTTGSIFDSRCNGDAHGDTGKARLTACAGTLAALTTAGGSPTLCNTAELSGAICASSGADANPFAPICSDTDATDNIAGFNKDAVQVSFCEDTTGTNPFNEGCSDSQYDDERTVACLADRMDTASTDRCPGLVTGFCTDTTSNSGDNPFNAGCNNESGITGTRLTICALIGAHSSCETLIATNCTSNPHASCPAALTGNADVALWQGGARNSDDTGYLTDVVASGAADATNDAVTNFIVGEAGALDLGVFESNTETFKLELLAGSEDGNSGFAVASFRRSNYYVGLLSQTNLGRPLASTDDLTVAWDAELRIIGPGTEPLMATFKLAIDFANNAIKIVDNGGADTVVVLNTGFGEPDFAITSGKFTANGVIYGTVNWGDAGTLTGLIGVDGAVAIFKSDVGATDAYVGGFVAAPAPAVVIDCSATGTPFDANCDNTVKLQLCGGPIDALNAAAGGSPAACSDVELSGAICGSRTGVEPSIKTTAGSNVFAPICDMGAVTLATGLASSQINRLRELLAGRCVTDGTTAPCLQPITGVAGETTVADCSANPFLTACMERNTVKGAFSQVRTTRQTLCTSATTSFNTLCDIESVTGTDSTFVSNTRIARGQACVDGVQGATGCGDEDTGYINAYCGTVAGDTNAANCPNKYAGANPAVTEVNVANSFTGKALNATGTALETVIASGAADDGADDPTNFIEVATGGTLLTTGTNHAGLTLTDTVSGFALANSTAANKLYVGLLEGTTLGAPLRNGTETATWDANLSVLSYNGTDTSTGTATFKLLVDYGMNNALTITETAPSITGLGVFSLTSATFTNNGVIYGSVGFATGGAGTLTGLIGADGAVGIFKSNDTEDASPSSIAYVGGFVAAPDEADCSAAGTPFHADCTDYDLQARLCRNNGVTPVADINANCRNNPEVQARVCAFGGIQVNLFNRDVCTGGASDFRRVRVCFRRTNAFEIFGRLGGFTATDCTGDPVIKAEICRANGQYANPFDTVICPDSDNESVAVRAGLCSNHSIKPVANFDTNCLSGAITSLVCIPSGPQANPFDTNICPDDSTTTNSNNIARAQACNDRAMTPLPDGANVLVDCARDTAVTDIICTSSGTLANPFDRDICTSNEMTTIGEGDEEKTVLTITITQTDFLDNCKGNTADGANCDRYTDCVANPYMDGCDATYYVAERETYTESLLAYCSSDRTGATAPVGAPDCATPAIQADVCVASGTHANPFDTETCPVGYADIDTIQSEFASACYDVRNDLENNPQCNNIATCFASGKLGKDAVSDVGGIPCNGAALVDVKELVICNGAISGGTLPQDCQQATIDKACTANPFLEVVSGEGIDCIGDRSRDQARNELCIGAEGVQYDCTLTVSRACASDASSKYCTETVVNNCTTDPFGDTCYDDDSYENTRFTMCDTTPIATEITSATAFADKSALAQNCIDAIDEECIYDEEEQFTNRFCQIGTLYDAARGRVCLYGYTPVNEGDAIVMPAECTGNTSYIAAYCTDNPFDTKDDACIGTAYDAARGRECVAGYDGAGSDNCGDEDGMGGTYVQAYCETSAGDTDITNCPDNYATANTAVAEVLASDLTGTALNAEGTALLPSFIAADKANEDTDAGSNFIVGGQTDLSLGADAGTITDITDDRNLTLVGDDTSGFAVASAGDNYYVGLLSGTDLGAPLTDAAQATWNGQLSITTSEGGGVYTISLNVNFNKKNLNFSKAALGLTDALTKFVVTGKFTDNGVIYGTVLFENNIADQGREDNEGTLTGLIGANGAVGIFASNADADNTYVGGFIASGVDCSTGGTPFATNCGGTTAKLPLCSGALDALMAASGTPALCNDVALSGAICGRLDDGTPVAGTNPFAPICDDATAWVAGFTEANLNTIRNPLAENCGSSAQEATTPCIQSITGVAGGVTVAACSKNPFLMTDNCYMHKGFMAEQVARINTCNTAMTSFNEECDIESVTGTEATFVSNTRIARGEACVTGLADGETCGDDATTGSYVYAYCTDASTAAQNNARDCGNTAYATANPAVSPVVATGFTDKILNAEGTAKLAGVITAGNSADTDATANFIAGGANALALGGTEDVNHAYSLTANDDGISGFAIASTEFTSGEQQLYVGLLANTNLGGSLTATINWPAKLRVLRNGQDLAELQTFILRADFASKTISVLKAPETGTEFQINGHFASNGLIYGNLIFNAGNRGADEFLTANQATLTGLIGAQGAVGIFSRDAGANSFVGGFVATRPALANTDDNPTLVTDNDWTRSFNWGETNAGQILLAGDGVPDNASASGTNRADYIQGSATGIDGIYSTADTVNLEVLTLSAGNGAAFGVVGTGSDTALHFAGLLSGTDVGAPITNNLGLVVWTGKIGGFVNGESVANNSDFHISVFYNGASGTIKNSNSAGILQGTSSPVMLGSRHFAFTGEILPGGVLKGTVESSTVSDFSINTQDGTFNGIFGANGLLAVFKSDVDNTNSAFQYAGAFAAVPSGTTAPTLTELSVPAPVIITEDDDPNLVTYTDWVLAQDNPSLTANTVSPRNQFLGTNVGDTALAGSGIVQDVAKAGGNLVIDGATVGGFSVFTNGTQFYAGILYGTDLGAPIIDTETTVTWSGSFRSIGGYDRDETPIGGRVDRETNFELEITLGRAGEDGSIAAFVPASGGSFYRIDGTFGANGYITGNVNFGSFNNNDRNDPLDGRANNGVLTGLIGQKGAIGVFVSNPVDPSVTTGEHNFTFAGGFAVTPPPPLPKYSTFVEHYGAQLPEGNDVASAAGGGFLRGTSNGLNTGGLDLSSGLTVGPVVVRLGEVVSGHADFNSGFVVLRDNGNKYRAGLLSDTDLGALLTPDVKAEWSGKAYLIRRAGIGSGDLTLTVDFDAGTINTTTAANLDNGAGSVSVRGRFGSKWGLPDSILGGSVSYDSINAGLIGLIGEKGVLGVFHPGSDQLSAGGFWAKPTEETAGSTYKTEPTLYSHWVTSFTGGVNAGETLQDSGVTARDIQSFAGNYIKLDVSGNIVINKVINKENTLNTLTTTTVRLNETSTEDGYESGFAYASDSDSFERFAGLLPTTDVGGAITAGPAKAIWTGSLKGVAGAPLSSDAFKMEVAFTGPGGTIKSLTADGTTGFAPVSGAPQGINFEGAFNDAGVMSGTTFFGFAGTGSFSGLIGAKGAVGVFRGGDNADGYAGGFVVKPPSN